MDPVPSFKPDPEPGREGYTQTSSQRPQALQGGGASFVFLAGRPRTGTPRAAVFFPLTVGCANSLKESDGERERQRPTCDGPVCGVGSSHGGDFSCAVTTAMPMPQTGFTQVVGGGFPFASVPPHLSFQKDR